MASKQKERLSREDWLYAGFRALCSGGAKAIRAEAIARELETTKGSFYWHFSNVPDFETAMLNFWQQKATGELIEALELVGEDPARQLATLVELVVEARDDIYGGLRAEMAIRDWAVYNPAAAEKLAIVDQLRLGWLMDRISALGHKTADSKILAINFYALVIGLEQLELVGKASVKSGLELALSQILTTTP